MSAPQIVADVVVGARDTAVARACVEYSGAPWLVRGAVWHGAYVAQHMAEALVGPGGIGADVRVMVDVAIDDGADHVAGTVVVDVVPIGRRPRQADCDLARAILRGPS